MDQIIYKFGERLKAFLRKRRIAQRQRHVKRTKREMPEWRGLPDWQVEIILYGDHIE